MSRSRVTVTDSTAIVTRSILTVTHSAGHVQVVRLQPLAFTDPAECQDDGCSDQISRPCGRAMMAREWITLARGPVTMPENV